MNEVATYIRCQINGKWTNLGLIAEEGEIQEHFEFIEGLLKEKQRADELEKRWSTLWQKLKYEYDIANNSTELRCFGMSLDIMHDLQEDNNA